MMHIILISFIDRNNIKLSYIIISENVFYCFFQGTSLWRFTSHSREKAAEWKRQQKEK